jgi:cbb3-type cytochrome oxidase maturation protein
MYFFGWITLVVITLAVSLFAFVWALESGQFSDQERARFLPLVDLAPVVRPSRQGNGGPGAYALMAVMGLGVAMLIAPIALVLFQLVGG